MKKTKAWNHSMTCLISGYRQVTIRTTSTEWSTPNEREPSVSLSSCVEYWRYSKWENKSQKLSISIQYLNDMFYIKLSERKRRLGVLRQSLAFLGDVSPWLQIPVRFCRFCGVCFVCPVLGFYMVFCRCAIAGSRNEYVFLPDVGAVSQWLMAKTYCGLTAFRCCKNSQNIPKVVF